MIPALEYLARNGWDVDSRDAAGQTALHKAAFLGYTVAIRTLLAFRADPSVRDSDGFTPKTWPVVLENPEASRCWPRTIIFRRTERPDLAR